MPQQSNKIRHIVSRLGQIGSLLHETWGRTERTSPLIVTGLVISLAVAISLALSAGGTPTATADTASLGATADTYVDEKDDGDNFGTDSEMEVQADSLCLHGDTPGAVDMARSLQKALIAEGVEVVPVGQLVKGR